MRLRTIGYTMIVAALALLPAACDRNARNDRGVAGTSGTMERSAERAGGAASDVSITAKVQSSFIADDVVKSRHIDVDTNDGVVTLKGDVESDVEHDRAETIAKQTDGVKAVVNNLRVNPQSTTGTSGRVGDYADRVGDKASATADKTGDKIAGGSRKAGGVIEDGWITAKIQSQYVADDIVKSRHIDVDTNAGIVTLKGAVKTKAEHDRAVQIASRTDGVKSVSDAMLKVDPAIK